LDWNLWNWVQINSSLSIFSSGICYSNKKANQPKPLLGLVMLVLFQCYAKTLSIYSLIYSSQPWGKYFLFSQNNFA
jgi:hypothetical protein